jgi:hypothetical protein
MEWMIEHFGLKIQTHTMHYITIDPKKSKIGTHDHALHHHWRPPKRQIRTLDMHYTNIDSHKVKDSNPGPYTIPPLTPEKVKDSN